MYQDIVRIEQYEDGGKKVEIGDYDVHEFASAFDILPEGEMNELADSIEKNGLRETIKVDIAGQILDGQNRLIACLLRGVTPSFKTITDDPKEYAVDANMRRRHLTPSQRATIYAELFPEKTREQQAEGAKVSVRAITQAAKVINTGTPQLVDAVKSGEVTLQDAVEVSDLPKEKQTELLAGLGKDDRTERQPKKKKGRAKAGDGQSDETVSDSVASDTKPVDPLKAAAKEIRAKKQIALLDKDKWKAKASTSLSLLFGFLEPELQDWGKKEIAHIVDATVRVQIEEAEKRESFEDSVLDAVGVVAKIGKIVNSLPKSERVDAEKAIAEKYQTKREPIKKHEQVLALIEGLSEAEKKKLLKALGVSAAPAEESPSKEFPTEPKKIAEHVRREATAACRKASQIRFTEDEHKKALVSAVDSIAKACSDMLVKTGSFSDAPAVVFPAHLDNESFRELWLEWIAVRRKTKGHSTNKTQNRQLEQLAHFDMAQAKEIVGKAIDNEWQGIPAAAQLRDTKWDGRPPAGPGEQKNGVHSPATQGVQQRTRNGQPLTERDTDRSKYGAFTPIANGDADSDADYDELLRQALL